MASLKVIDRVKQYIKDELRPNDGSKETSRVVVEVAVNRVEVPLQVPDSLYCGPLILYYGFKLIMVRLTLILFF